MKWFSWATAVVAAARFVTAIPTPLALSWNIDSNTEKPQGFGFDGPWATINVGVGSGNATSNDLPPGFPPGTIVALYPDWSDTSTILNIEAGGFYDSNNSTTWILEGESGNTQSFGASIANFSNTGTFGLDTIQVIGDTNYFTIPNASIASLSAASYTSPANISYAATVGSLGLGSSATTRTPGAPDVYATSTNPLLSYLQQNGTIPSNSWSLHIGSVPLGQSGSLILGGYDNSRAIGPAGVFDLNQGIPYVILRDVTIGVETGGSPFNQTSFGSLYSGTGGSNLTTLINQGFNLLDNNSAIMELDPTLPYMYFPFGTCERIAAQLPVTWLDSLGLYTWNVADPSYAQIVTSPAFLSLVFAQSASQNFTIKVPFRLLNLTLDKPLVNQPVQYFPCKSSPDTTGFWTLGRAFLQAAFMGISWDQNKLFLAQAPGPNVGPTNILPLSSTDINITPSDSILADTWAQSWTPLPLSSQPPTPQSQIGTENSTSSLSGGTIAGIAISALVAVALFVFVLLIWRRRRRRRRVSAYHPELQSPSGELLDNKPHELNGAALIESGGSAVYEAGGNGFHRYEMGDSAEYEAGSTPIYELSENVKGNSR